jgi:hypothetical protein
LLLLLLLLLMLLLLLLLFSSCECGESRSGESPHGRLIDGSDGGGSSGRDGRHKNRVERVLLLGELVERLLGGAEDGCVGVGKSVGSSSGRGLGVAHGGSDKGGSRRYRGIVGRGTPDGDGVRDGEGEVGRLINGGRERSGSRLRRGSGRSGRRDRFEIGD